MIETDGMISVAEAAKRLNRSIEQVRRYLREGKLKGQRIGNQWFVDEASAANLTDKPDQTVADKRRRVFEQARTLREEMRKKYGNFDIDAMIAASREDS